MKRGRAPWPDRPGRLRALGARAVSARRARQARCRRLVLTASGGPFRGRSRAELADRHARARRLLTRRGTWARSSRINSATLVNKGLEVIEAHLLFDVPLDRIDVVVHPQSVVHSMVEFTDGSTIAQASPPDMHLPIALALGLAGPRGRCGRPACDWTAATSWTFEPLDDRGVPRRRPRAVKPSARADRSTAVFNAANEECVEAFVAGRLPFLGIVDTVADVVHAYSPADAPTTIADVLDAETWARSHAQELIEKAAA